MITVENLVFNHWQENTYILHDETGEAVVIDCGCYFKEEGDKLFAFLKEKGLKLVMLLNTHLHIDHVLGNHFVLDEYKLLTQAHADDDFLLGETMNYAFRLGLEGVEHPPKVGHYLKDGDMVHFGNSQLKVLHVPGHSPGGICFYNEEQEFVIAGDVLFFESIGRTDLPYGDYEQLMGGIKEKLLVLDDHVKVFPGHGPSTSIGHERKHNVFLRSITQ